MREQIHQARWIGILAATGIALYLCWLMLRPFITVLEWVVLGGHWTKGLLLHPAGRNK